MRLLCPKKCQDRIPHSTGNQAFMSLNRLNEKLKCFTYNLGPNFRIQFLRHSGGTDHIGKQNRDLLSLFTNPVQLRFQSRSFFLQRGNGRIQNLIA